MAKIPKSRNWVPSRHHHSTPPAHQLRLPIVVPNPIRLSPLPRPLRRFVSNGHLCVLHAVSNAANAVWLRRPVSALAQPAHRRARGSRLTRAGRHQRKSPSKIAHALLPGAPWGGRAPPRRGAPLGGWGSSRARCAHRVADGGSRSSWRRSARALRCSMVRAERWGSLQPSRRPCASGTYRRAAGRLAEWGSYPPATALFRSPLACACATPPCQSRSRSS
jgi:hypothetical protein